MHLSPGRVKMLRISARLVTQGEITGSALIAGMPAEVFIKTGEKTLLQYLADPLVDTVARSFIED